MIYVFLKRIYSQGEVDALTREQAHELAENDFIGVALEYETFDDFATDFNNGCFVRDRYIIKMF